MPHRGKNEAGKAGDVGPFGQTEENNETFGEALSKAGFEPAKVERRIVHQGKRRESLKKWASKVPDK